MKKYIVLLISICAVVISLNGIRFLSTKQTPLQISVPTQVLPKKPSYSNRLAQPISESETSFARDKTTVKVLKNETTKALKEVSLQRERLQRIQRSNKILGTDTKNLEQFNIKEDIRATKVAEIKLEKQLSHLDAIEKLQNNPTINPVSIDPVTQQKVVRHSLNTGDKIQSLKKKLPGQINRAYRISGTFQDKYRQFE